MEPASFPDDCLPPEGEYESRDALFKAINTWAQPKGYAFTTGKSTREKSGRQTVTYSCDRCCQPPSAFRERRRKTTTRGTGCQFSVLAKESLDKTVWTLRHRPDRRFSIHNHEPSQHPSAHPVHRILSKETVTTLASLSNAGIAPKDIRTYIRQNHNVMATQQDIYNRIADTKRAVCEGQSSIHALANQLDKEGFWSRMQFDSDGRVTAVLFAHPDSLAYLQAYPDTLLLDCTYKTNKYGMPLLDIIGVDACQRSFCIAFAFLSGETEQDYLWALDRLKSLYEVCNTRLPSVILTDRCIACMNAAATCFPSAASLLCLWHANKAVLRHCQPTFTRQQQGLGAWNEFYKSWHSIIRSPDEETFYKRVQDFEKQYLPEYIEEVGYIKTTWLDPYKEKLVKAWVDRHPHFGNVVTSRCEGIHGLLKGYLKRSTLDLFEAWRAIKHALLNQLMELKSNQAKQQLRLPIELSGSLYGAVRGWVSHEALRKVEEQRKLLTRRDPPFSPTCSGSFSRSMGLPCVHILKDLLDRNLVLRLDHFSSHWHLKRDGAPQFLLEPRQRIDPVVTNSTIPQSSTRREPSGFETVEATTRPKVLPRCSRCHTLGHIMTSKACPQRHMELLQLASAPEPISQATGAAIPPSQLIIEDTPPPPTPPPPIPLPLLNPPSTSLEYYDPRAIYQRYVKARDAWYKAQPRGSIKTNQQYRKAMGLPLRYDKASYEWCLDYKQMTKQCTTSTGSRDWTKEEMMAYLDWSNAEDDRIEALVAQERENEPFDTGRRGVGDIWRRVERDIEEQRAVYSAENPEEQCIIVSA